jgi:hypothetical protein
VTPPLVARASIENGVDGVPGPKPPWGPAEEVAHPEGGPAWSGALHTSERGDGGRGEESTISAAECTSGVQVRWQHKGEKKTSSRTQGIPGTAAVSLALVVVMV